MRSVLLLAVLAACGSDETEGPRSKTFGGDRPADLRTPETLTDGKQYPLVMVLHGFGASGFIQAAYFGATALPTADEALVIAPDGIVNSGGMQFWNADPACCDLENQRPDDVAYLGTMLDDIIATWPVDPARVFVIGHSNGGFMAYRMACERADIIVGIMALAGLASTTPASCTPDEPVSVLHIHGTADATVPYAANTVGAEPSVAQWAQHNGCSGIARTAGAMLDLDNAVAGAETRASATDGCPETGAVDLWTLEGSGHLPSLTAAFTPAVMDWLLAHPRS